ncbi:MAG: pyrroline-5-carboxylate reductase dimerization domain-containing protein [Methanomassiliicoccales archaeon]|jgi:pyrroline-5-carboxylate reductase
MRVCFVGYGNMGSTLLKGLLERGALTESDIIVTNRTLEKLDGLRKIHPGVKIVNRCAEMSQADIIFICVRTGEVKGTLEEMQPCLNSSTHIVTINGGLQIKNLERVFQGKITKAIPSMTMGSGHGVTLICHNDKVDAISANVIENMFAQVGLVHLVREDQFEVAADLTSCAPAFFADIAQKFAEAGIRHSDLDEKIAKRMVVETLLGTALTLSKGEISFDELKSKVATKGGISEQGLAVLDREMPGMFDRVLEATVSKHETVKDSISSQFDK